MWLEIYIDRDKSERGEQKRHEPVRRKSIAIPDVDTSCGYTNQEGLKENIDMRD